MALVPVVVDTDILLAIMRRNPQALSQARVYLDVYGQFTLSIITRFEDSSGSEGKRCHQPHKRLLCILARVSGGSDVSICQKIAKNSRMPQADVQTTRAKRLARAFGVSVDYLVGMYEDDGSWDGEPAGVVLVGA